MGIVINGVFDVRWPTLADKRSGKMDGSKTVPYDNIEEVTDEALPPAYRQEGLILFVRDPEDAARLKWWQFQGGITIDDLVDVTPGNAAPGGSPEPQTGTITAPGDVIFLTAGLYREIVMQSTANNIVRVGRSVDAGEYVMDGQMFANAPFVATIGQKFNTNVGIYVATQQTINYEIYKA